MKTLQHLHITFLLVVLSSFAAKAVSTGEITGQVIENETRKPIAFAHIIFENGMDKIEVNANEYGYYYGNHIPTGRYQMRVVYNNHTFVMNKVRVYDSYSAQINFIVSNNSDLPLTIEVIKKDPIISPIQTHDITLVSNTHSSQGTQSMSELLVTQPGLDIRDGKLYVKGGDQVRFFIDGTPVMAPPVIDRIW
ncbi:MAG: TonB-dependent receptor plug [Bacteroidota bacterium]|nr:TonB-dependent receptor plug [Bacteroidota bacterium]